VRVAALVLAAGSGTRLGAAVPKALVDVRGSSLVARSTAVFVGHARVDDVVVLAPAAQLDDVRMLCARSPAHVVAGGLTRQASVAAGLAALHPAVDAVLVHDSARAFVPSSVLDRVLERLDGGAEAVIPVLPVTDAIKRVDEAGAVVETLHRPMLRAVQTPQGFRRAVLDRAHRAARERGESDAVDDAALAEALGVRVQTVLGDALAFKITVPADLRRAEVLDV
jgi:2-C-methyl-D-erythritol 4-phosphate cytidylyltransferase